MIGQSSKHNALPPHAARKKPNKNANYFNKTQHSVNNSVKYWLIAFLGYFCNLIAIPLLALAGSWQLAAALIILERIGKAIRTPSRDAMLSYATQKMGRGWGFGLHQVLDQIGGMLGPLIVTVVLFLRNDYRLGFAWFLGSWLIGILYDISIPWLIGFSIVAQLSSIPFIYIVQKRLR